MGRVRMNVATGDTDVVDLAHHKNATSPNLIHSLDRLTVTSKSY